MGQAFTTHINIHKWYGDDFQVVAACNRGAERRAEAEGRFGLKAFQDPADVIKEGIDFGLVASTTAAHREHVCLLAEAGIPIFCEKPIALDLDDGRQMVEVLNRTGVPSVVNFSRRLESCNLKIKQMIDGGEFGRVMSFSSFIARAHGFYSEGARHRAVVEPEESGGWTLHHCCHQTDLACCLLGEVDAVSVVSLSTVEGIESQPGLPSEEVVCGRLHFKSGAIGTVFDAVGGVRDSHLSVIGTRCAVGVVQAGDAEVLKVKREGDPEWGPPRIVDPRVDFPRKDNLHHFLEVVRDGVTSRVTIQDAFYSLRVGHAMRESACRNGEKVNVDL